MHRCERSLPLVQARSCSCPANRRNIERPPIVETSVCKLSALTAGRRSMRHRLAMSQKPTTCGLDRCANEMNWCHAGRYLFARSRHGSTTSTRSRNSTGRRVDLADGLRTGVLPQSVRNMAISGSWLSGSTHVYVETNFPSEAAGEENE